MSLLLLFGSPGAPLPPAPMICYPTTAAIGPYSSSDAITPYSSSDQIAGYFSTEVIGTCTTDVGQLVGSLAAGALGSITLAAGGETPPKVCYPTKATIASYSSSDSITGYKSTEAIVTYSSSATLGTCAEEE